MRLSFPRYLEKLSGQPLTCLILREIFLAGSLTKAEIVTSITDLKRNQQVKQYTAKEVEKEVDELTLTHYLVGVSAQTVAITEAVEEAKYTRKRDHKKQSKDKAKQVELQPTIET